LEKTLAKEVSEEDVILKILAQLSCLPQINRYEYYMSRGDSEKAREILRQISNDLREYKSRLQNILRRLWDVSQEFEKKRDIDPLRSLVKDLLKMLDNAPWTVSGCHKIKAHTEASLYKISLELDKISSEKTLDERSVNILLRELDYLRSHLRDIVYTYLEELDRHARS
jgi:hypothetical protein